MNEPGPTDPIDMMEVRLVARQLAGGKVHHLSSHVILEAVNEIIRRRSCQPMNEAGGDEYAEAFAKEMAKGKLK